MSIRSMVSASEWPSTTACSTASSAARSAASMAGTPAQNATRGEVAQMLYNLLKVLGVVTD